MRVSGGSAGESECLVGVVYESVWWEWLMRVSGGSCL